MDIMSKEKLEYLMNHLEWFIEESVYDVLSDSDEDPEHSAVTTANLIQCYIDVALSLELPVSFCSVEDFLKDKCLSLQEIQKFEESRKHEAEYYIGKQYYPKID